MRLQQGAHKVALADAGASGRQRYARSWPHYSCSMAPSVPPARFMQMLWAMIGGGLLLGIGTVALEGWPALLIAMVGLAVVIFCGYRAFITYDDWRRRTPPRDRA